MRTSTAPIECHTEVCRALKSNLSMIKASKISVALTTATTVGGAFYLNLNQSFQLGSLQGLPSGFDLMYLALADRNMQVRFGLKVVWES